MMRKRQYDSHSHFVVAPVMQVNNKLRTTFAERTLIFRVPAQNSAISHFSRCCVADREHNPQAFLKSALLLAEFRAQVSAQVNTEWFAAGALGQEQPAAVLEYAGQAPQEIKMGEWIDAARL